MSPSPRSRSARVDPPPLKGGGTGAAAPELAPLLPKGGIWVGERGANKLVLRKHAKRMRREPTPTEHRLWQILRVVVHAFTD